ncbi:MAG: class I SAM-dependent methyltransferase [Parcubacteria group bacterium]
MEYYKNIKKCRICGSKDLIEVIHIAPQYLSPTFVRTNEKNELSKIKVPLTLTFCDCKRNLDGCGLLQLKETVNPDLLYKNYFYRTAVSSTMCEDLHEVVEDVLKHVKLNDGDYVIDIGANDCTMLGYFPSSLNRIGVEPAKNIDLSSLDPSIKFINDYFSKKTVENAIRKGSVRAITCCAMFYDLDDPNSFVSDIKSILAPDGIWCIQLSYLPLMLKNMNFYDICNEHLEYYSLHTLKNLMKRHSLSIFDASTNNVNGGSIRVFISHTGNNYKPSVNLERLYMEEERMNLYDAATYKDFYKKILDLKNKVNNVITKEINKGNLVLGLGASTKGNVLLQLFGITKEMLPYISERNPEKVGLRTLGTDIGLISEEDARKLNPSYMLVLPWYFKKEIVKREVDYLRHGGKLLFPMPYPHIVDKNGETNL